MRSLGSVIRLFALLVFGMVALALPMTAKAQLVVNINIAPPVLPIYEQPALPAPGYIWIPGYWAWGPDGYFWVPGTWELPPTVGLLWTPGYWGWRDGLYVWNAGYWGPHIGFYGGVDYGFGYGGVGYGGGRWNNGVFVYNTTVNNFGSVHVTNVYSETIVVNANASRASFNGGNGGTNARPTPQEEAATHERHTPPTTAQAQHQQMASTNRSLLASENHGHPAIAATAKPAEFSGKGVVAAKEAAPAGAGAGEHPNGMGEKPNAAAVGEKPNAATPGAPGGAKPNTTLGEKPAGAGPGEKNGAGTNATLEKKGSGAPGAPVANTAIQKNGPGGNAAPEKKGPAAGPGGQHANLNGSTPPKVNAVVKPANVPPPKKPAAAPHPQPHVAAAPHPHPAAAPHPPVKPAPHPAPAANKKKQ
jgi:WXXGXW repeat (2 copies)